MNKRHMFKVAVVVVCASMSTAVHADPKRIYQGQLYEQQKLLREHFRRQENVKLEGAVSIEGIPHPSVDKLDKGSPVFMLKQLVYSASEVFTPGELQAFSQDLLNTEVTLAKIRAFATSLETHYIEQGYIARAILPPQTIRDGVVSIRLIEARVGELKLKRNRSTNASFITRRLDAPAAGELLDIHRLERAMININNVYDINLGAQLQPGEALGSSDIMLAVSEPEQHLLTLTLDNNGNESTGDFRQQLAYSNASLTGRRDRLDANIRNSDGSTDRALSYSFYWPATNIRTLLFYADSDIDIVDGPVSDLGVNGGSEVILLDVSKPVYVTSDSAVTLRASLENTDSATNIDAVELEQTTTDSFKIGMGYWHRYDRVYWTTSVALGRHKTGGAFSSTQISDQEYSTLSGNAFLFYDMSKPYSLEARAAYQFSSEDQLPSSGEFQIGGLGSIRGYDSGVLSGYQGHYLNLELHRNWKTNYWQQGSLLDGYVFLDNGQIDPGDSRRDDTLNSLGFGLDWKMRQGVNFSATVALAETQLEDDDDDTSFYLRIDVPLLSLW